MRIVIGYDGSEYADAALDDLRHAGLPRDAEVLIISVAEGVMAPLSVSGIAENALGSRRVASAVAQASYALAQAQEFARLGDARIKSLFPEWKVSADLICMGVRGAGFDLRALFGSNTDRVLRQAPCPVRIARPLKVDGLAMNAA
jgi:nucleotide-binding universal stress UspA family protein